MAKVKCKKCGKEGAAVPQAPYPGALGESILKNTCLECLEAWKKFSVMVINDYKLRPFLPQDRAVLERHMKEFLNLEGQGISQKLTGQGKEITFETAAKNPLKEKVIEMLQQVFDPEVPVNIYDLGLIYNIAVTGDKAEIKMTLTSQHCPAAQSLPDAVKTAVSRIPGIKEVVVNVVWDPPWTRQMISEEGRKSLGI